MAEINLWALIVVKLSELGILKRYILYRMKGGNPKHIFCHVVVTYCDLTSWRTRLEYPSINMIRYITVQTVIILSKIKIQRIILVNKQCVQGNNKLFCLSVIQIYSQ